MENAPKSLNKQNAIGRNCSTTHINTATAIPIKNKYHVKVSMQGSSSIVTGSIINETSKNIVKGVNIRVDSNSKLKCHGNEAEKGDFIQSCKSLSVTPFRYGSQLGDPASHNHLDFIDFPEESVADEGISINNVPTFESRFNFSEIKGKKVHPDHFNMFADEFVRHHRTERLRDVM